MKKREFRDTELLGFTSLGGCPDPAAQDAKNDPNHDVAKIGPRSGSYDFVPRKGPCGMVGRPMSQMEGCLGFMIGEDDNAIAGEMNAIEIKTAATYVRMNTLPLPGICCRRESAIADRALRQCTRFKLLFWRDRRPVQSSLVHRSSVTFQ